MTAATRTRPANPTVQVVAAIVGAVATTLAGTMLGCSPTVTLGGPHDVSCV